MNKKHFIQLADMIRVHNNTMGLIPFDTFQIESLVDFCKAQNPRFSEDAFKKACGI